ncbi:retention module-containing protein [Vibrio sp. ZSDE26]|uniref:Retention module-containing protein n=1 Tax=Vibrio amylolyticus TaxID=2847292 RepID=A0A9X1XHD8_9VIBR|nr:retention module-containing protein [Vibrio amylolyticus]MCK6261748.1 retention module-containing protein [Vibrio amylolyticus]
MDVDVIRQDVLIKDVAGDVVVFSVDGSGKKAHIGDTITQGHIVITANNSSITLVNANSELNLNANCVACGDADGGWGVAPVAGEVNFDLEQLNNADISEEDLAAIQEAILAGADPTELLEATAAGGAGGSANAGFVTIEYNGASVLASTFFETSTIVREEIETADDENRPLSLATGGEGVTESLSEGSLSLNSYSQTITTSITVSSGDLSLDPDSFVPETTSLSSLLNELNSDITSSGEAVLFRYDEVQNAIIGENSEGVVLRIDINAVPTGNDVSLELTTTISQPIDHLSSVGSGQVSISDDQITLSFDIQGADSAGNALITPINAEVIVEDGVDATVTTVKFQSVESDSNILEGELVQIGSDFLSSAIFDNTALAQFDGLLSDNQETVASLSGDRTELTLSLVGSNEPILTVTINTDGRYTYQQFKPLEHNDSDEVSLSLPTIITDFDQDSVTNSIDIVITDGNNPVITGVSALDLDESGVDGGANEGNANTSGTGQITYEAGSDAIDHFELAPDEFNSDNSLTSQGQAIQLELITLDNGVRSYEGFIEVEGNRIPVFEVSVDTPALGDYSFTLLEQIDHLGADDLLTVINLPVYAVDTDGDRSSLSQGETNAQAATIQVTVQDDTLELVDNSFSVTEPTQAGDTSVFHSLFNFEGADTATIQSFTYSGSQYTLDQNASDDTMQRFDFAEGTHSISLNGEFEFVVARDIDHSANETIDKQFVFTARDADGDEDTATVDLQISDGGDPTINVVPSVSLSESNLSDGSAPSSSVVSMTQSIDYSEGSDDVNHFRIATDEFNTDDALTSNGLVVQLREEPDDSGQYLGFTTNVLGEETAVFTLTFNHHGHQLSDDKGQYTFTLIEALDHADGLKNNSLSFDLPVYAVDTDGDDSAMKPLLVSIEDDVQSMLDGGLTITEPSVADLAAGNPTTDSINLFDTPSADGTTITQFSYDSGDPIALNPAITGEQAFDVAEGTLYITITGDVRFEPSRDLDHSAGDIVKSLVVTSSDGDNDTLSSTVTLTIQDGDIPQIESVPTVSLSEANLDDGSDPNSPNASNPNVSRTQSIDYTVGSDDISHFQIAVNEFNTDEALTSNGLVVKLREEPADSGQYIGFTKDNSDKETSIFTITFNNFGKPLSDDKGQYTFTLIEALDHVDGLQNNTLSFELPIYAVDTDGDDSIMKPLLVNIEDDVQSMQDGGLSITEPSVADLAAGAPTTESINLFDSPSADGAVITQFSYEGGDPITLNPAILGEQAFDVTDGTLYISIAGDVRFEPNRDLDHSAGNIVKSIEVTSNDTDNDTLSSIVTVAIKDGENPHIDSVPAVKLSETNLGDGSNPDNSSVTATQSINYTEGSDDVSHFRIDSENFNTNEVLTSNGLAVQLREDPADSGQYLAFTMDSSDKETPVFTITFINFGNPLSDDKGQYTFTLIEALDHEDGLENNNLSFELPVYAVDSDGDDSTMKLLSVNIEDDVQSMQDVGLTITEPSVAELAAGNPTTDPINVFDTPSADGATITQFSYDGGNLITLNPAISGEQAFDVTDGTLYISIAGDVRFEPSRDLDHSKGDIVKSIVVTSSDGDNDTLSSTATLTIKDGDNPQIESVPAVNLSELNLDDGSNPNGSSISTTQSIGYTEGSDDVSHFRIASDEFNTDDALTSNGLIVQLREEPVGTGQYLGFTVDGSDKETSVFTITFNNFGNPLSDDKGQYTFTLLEAFDHVDGLQHNTLSFELPVYAVDTDGDNSVKQSLLVTIVDDVPVIDGIIDTSVFSVNESGLSSDSPQASGQFVTTDGADGVVSYALQNTSNTESDLYSGGNKVSIDEVSGAANSTTYQGVANGKVVFTLALTNDGAYTFTLLEPLDHLSGSDLLSIPFDVVAIDTDGDISEGISLPIDIVDDKPVLSGTTGERNVDEDDLGGTGSDQSDDTSLSGFFTISEGADGVVEYELVNAAETLDGLTSGGEALEWGDVSQNMSPSGTTFTYTAQTESGTPIFTIIFDTQDNSYQFELLGVLDHSIANSEDSIQLEFTIVANDFDGDVSNQITLPITIIDDVPLVSAQSISRIEGQGFRNSKVSMFDATTDEGADTASLTKVEGTTENGATIVFGGPRGSYLDSVDLNDGRQNIRVYEQTDNGAGGTETRQLGILRVNSNGDIEFRANGNLEHDSDEINFSINVTATDGDLDTSTAPLEISISDKESRPISLKVTTFEDSGRDVSIKYAAGEEPETANIQDNQSGLADRPAQVSLQVNLFDSDNNESIGALTIKDGNHQGTFYYLKDGEYHKLEADPVTGSITFDGALIQQSFSQSGNNTIATIDNLFFVPDRNVSTGNGGVKIHYQLEIDNDGVADHTMDSNFRIEIESVADIAQWNDSRSTYQYEVGEDDSNVRLQLRAESQDTSRAETLTYELKVIDGEGEFELLDRNGDVLTPINGVYIIAANDINRVEVNPIDNFSGQIRFEATAITEERSNSYNDGVNDKSDARSPSQEIVIDVTPSADMGSFRVQRAQINEDNIDNPDYYGDEPNYNAFTLDEVITMTPSADSDGSEALFVRISDVTENATLEWIGSGDSQIVEMTIDGVTYYEIPYEQLSSVDVVPEKHSNEDFSFKVTGVVKDSAELSDGNIHVDEQILGSKTVNVEVKGVADEAVGATLGSHWSDFVDGDVQGVETTITESHNGDSFAILDFTIISGERVDKPLDDSESVTVLLSNIPEGVVIEDSDGTQIDLNFVGYDGNGQPIYEANITGAHNTSGIVVRPIDSSTDNIHVTASVIVTENDGHVHTFDQEVRINVEPVIDTSETYSNSAIGNEDQPINIDWHPEGTDYIDSDEHFTSITLEDIPLDAQVIVNNGLVNVKVTVSADGLSQVLEIEPNGMTPEAFTQAALKNNFIQIVPPQDSSSDFNLKAIVEIEERDHEYTSDDIVGEGGRVTATLTGDISVVVRAIVEAEDSDNKLGVSDENGFVDFTSITADSQGVIRFTTNSDNQSVDLNGDETWDGEYVIHYNETDASSVEVVSDVIIELTHTDGSALDALVISQLLVTGAAYEGNGRWVITDEDAFSVSAPQGLDLTPLNPSDSSAFNNIKMSIETLVQDKGEDANERSPNAFRESSITLSFPETVVAGDEVAAEIAITEDSLVSATEDTPLNLGQQLDSIISFTGADDSADEITIVLDNKVTIDGVTYPISISGAEVDFVNGQFVFQANISDLGVVESLDGLTVTLPKDFSGDFRLPIKVITQDTTSGDTNVAQGNVVINVNPIADVGGDVPTITLEVTGSLDDNMTAIDQDGVSGADSVGYEDSYIQLNIGHELADKVTGVEGGQEALSSIRLTLAKQDVGAFYDSDGNNLGTELFFSESQISAGALDNILFRAKENYPGDDDQNEVTINISGTVTDTATFDEFATQTAEHSADFSTSVSFDVVPVLDKVEVTGPGDNPSESIEITTNEDTSVSLGDLAPVTISLTDLDGSEQFVSLKFVDVPDGFLLSAESGYTVKNNGDGVWSVQIPSDAGTTLNLGAISIQPPKNFSGSAEFGVTVFTQESLLGVPTEVEGLPNFVLNVVPVGDSVDVDATDAITGLEGQNIDIEIDASVIDRTDAVSGHGMYSENSAEVLRVEVTNVPQDASIYHPDGITQATYNAVTDTWTLDIDAQHLDKIVFNSGEHNSGANNGGTSNVMGIDSPLTITVQSVDKDAEGNEYLGPQTSFDVELTIDPVNDQPTFVNVVNLETQEDINVAIDSFSIADIDATFDDPDADYTLALSVDKGELLFFDATGVDFSLDAQGHLSLFGSVADINAALSSGKVVFSPDEDSNNDNSSGSVIVTASVDDGGNNGVIYLSDVTTSPTNQTTFEIKVTEVNDQPEANNLDYGIILEEGQIIIYAQDLINATDDKEGDIIQVTGVSVAEGQGELVQSDDGTYWTFTAADEFNGDVKLSYTVVDNGTTNTTPDPLHDSAEVSFTVQGVNDEPVIDGSHVTHVVSEADSQLISGINISDPDYVGEYADDLMTVTITVTEGVLSVVLPDGSNVSITGADSQSIVLTGSLSELNAVIDTPVNPNGMFLDASDVTSSNIGLDVVARDSGCPSGIVIETDPSHYDITVTPVADTPTLSVDPAMNYIKNMTASQTASNNGIAIVGLLATLTDTSETLSLRLTGLPEDVNVTSDAGLIDYSSGVWIVSFEAIDSLKVDSVEVGEYSVTVTAVSEESNGGQALSAPITLQLNVVSDESIIGSADKSEDQYLFGDGENSTMNSGSGNDRLEGGAGDDSLSGGDGNDIIDGGLGYDVLTGGTGMDTFVWHEIDNGVTDTITDFHVDEGDQIDLREVLPELKAENVDLDTLLGHIDATIEGDDVELHVHPHGVGQEEQTILVEDLAPQLSLVGSESNEIISALIDQQIIIHEI